MSLTRLNVGGHALMLAERPIAARVDDADLERLSPSERARATGFSSERRVREFVAGRLAARDAMAALIGPLPAALAIDRHDDGAPRIVGLASEVSLTISHAERSALAVVASGALSIGLDLTDHADAARIRRVARRAFPRAEERERCLASDADAIAAWAIKEACAKALRVGLLEQGGFARFEVTSLAPPEMRLHPIEWLDDPRPLAAPSLACVGHREGVVALALTDSSRVAAAPASSVGSTR